ncbi:glycosyltransferase family 4 protein [Candidatus Blastococcus massiliensis]|uniref:glycosyltransferase family 4 protein n=1 Tax=Candidatus Blastococcus massiliensis TaxID=1470358 RepID=UPI0004B72790|nr:glycosyltransferase family 4 protein [Candidatus Blastococcus massiliensis]
MSTDRPDGAVVAVHPHADLYGSDRMFLESVATLAPGATVVLPKRGPLLTELDGRNLSYEVRPFPVLRKVELRTPWKVFVFLLQFVRSVIVSTAWLRSRRTSVLYVSTVAAPQWLIAGRLSGARVVCHVHESEPQMSRISSAVLLAPLLAAHLVIANSEDCLTWITSSLGRRTARRCQVIYNGVREPAPEAVPSTDRASTRRSVVVVGRLAARKGQDVAIAATALVRNAGYDVQLTLVGDGYPGYEDYVDGLRALAVAEDVGEAIEFVGFQDPVEYVAAADVVLVPSRVEPFGLVAVEALLLGRPVVASRVGGLQEIIEDGRTGLLVDPDDPRALADAIIRLLSDPATATRLGLAGQADARARFSMEAYSATLSQAVLQRA